MPEGGVIVAQCISIRIRINHVSFVYVADEAMERGHMLKLALIANGIIMTLIGLQALFTPAGFLGDYGVDLPSASALAEARSIHGGGFSALGLLMWLGLLWKEFRLTALRTAAFFMIGLAFGRTLGIVFDGAFDFNTFFSTAVEIILGVLAIMALQRERASAQT